MYTDVNGFEQYLPVYYSSEPLCSVLKGSIGVGSFVPDCGHPEMHNMVVVFLQFSAYLNMMWLPQMNFRFFRPHGQWSEKRFPILCWRPSLFWAWHIWNKLFCLGILSVEMWDWVSLLLQHLLLKQLIISSATPFVIFWICHGLSFGGPTHSHPFTSTFPFFSWKTMWNQKKEHVTVTWVLNDIWYGQFISFLGLQISCSNFKPIESFLLVYVGYSFVNVYMLSHYNLTW